MTTHSELHEVEHHVPVRDIVVGAVTVVMVGALIVGLAFVVKAAVEILGMVALAG